MGTERTGTLDASTRTFHVVVAVDGDEALRLAAALADEKLEVVRSTGAAPSRPHHRRRTRARTTSELLRSDRWPSW